MTKISHQGKVWDREYQNPKLMTGGDKPQADVLRFFKFLKKEKKFIIEDKKILDLGCGTGRNSNYLAERGNNVIGIEISKTALGVAQKNAREKNLTVDYRLEDIGKPYDIVDNSIDIVLDVTSSNSLDESGREIYLKEVHRVLKNDGYFFVRALCKDGDENAKKLLKRNHGKEKDTYFIKKLGITERVFSREDFVKMYSQYFNILKLEKKTGYTRFEGRVYKRNYWLAYLQK